MSVNLENQTGVPANFYDEDETKIHQDPYFKFKHLKKNTNQFLFFCTTFLIFKQF